jgi:hypothetical protein
MISLLVALVVFVLVVWILRLLLAHAGLGEPVNTIVLLVVALLFLLWLLGYVGTGSPVRL